MSEEQAKRAMELLARLYAEKMGFVNPQIIITKKTKNQQKP